MTVQELQEDRAETQEESALGGIVDSVRTAAGSIQTLLEEDPKREWTIREIQKAASERTGERRTIVSIAFNHLLQQKKLTVGPDLMVRIS